MSGHVKCKVIMILFLSAVEASFSLNSFVHMWIRHGVFLTSTNSGSSRCYPAWLNRSQKNSSLISRRIAPVLRLSNNVWWHSMGLIYTQRFSSRPPTPPLALVQALLLYKSLTSISIVFHAHHADSTLTKVLFCSLQLTSFQNPVTEHFLQRFPYNLPQCKNLVNSPSFFDSKILLVTALT